MIHSHLVTDVQPTTELSPEGANPDPLSDPETLAYMELTPRQTFAVAYALVAHCRRFGQPSTPLQHEISGLRDFLLDLLDEHEVEVLLESI